jgi:hypothetical protein
MCPKGSKELVSPDNKMYCGSCGKDGSTEPKKTWRRCSDNIVYYRGRGSEICSYGSGLENLWWKVEMLVGNREGQCVPRENMIIPSGKEIVKMNNGEEEKRKKNKEPKKAEDEGNKKKQAEKVDNTKKQGEEEENKNGLAAKEEKEKEQDEKWDCFASFKDFGRCTRATFKVIGDKKDQDAEAENTKKPAEEEENKKNQIEEGDKKKEQGISEGEQ